MTIILSNSFPKQASVLAVCEGQRVLDAIVESGAAAEVAVQVEAGVAGFQVLEGLQEYPVADVVLRNGQWPEGVEMESGIALEFEEGGQVADGLLNELICWQLPVFGLLDAADKAHEGDFSIGGAVREQRGGKDAAEGKALFEPWDEDAESVERMADPVAVVAEDQRGKRRVIDAGKVRQFVAERLLEGKLLVDV